MLCMDARKAVIYIQLLCEVCKFECSRGEIYASGAVVARW